MINLTNILNQGTEEERSLRPKRRKRDEIIFDENFSGQAAGDAEEDKTFLVDDSGDVFAQRKTIDPVFGRLQPLDGKVDPIVLYDCVACLELYATVFVCGRCNHENLSKETEDTQTYSFLRMSTTGCEIFRMVSRKHFTIEREDGRSYIVDYSSNGTFLNNIRLSPSGSRVELRHADVISIGLPHIHLWLYDERMRITDYPEGITDKYLVSNMEVGKGGYSRVVLAKVRTCAWRRVAIKVLQKHASSQFSRMFTASQDVKRELQIMCSIKHPNCMGYLDFVEDEHRAFIVLEYLSGGDLFSKITERKCENGRISGLGENLAKFYCYQLLKALDYIHKNGITHRDIKPENILLADKNDYTLLKLGDFGLAKSRFESSQMNTFVGTPAYVAPEIQSTRDSYTCAVDMWSAGVVLFLMICGYAPFCEGYTDMVLEEQIRTGRLVFTSVWKRVSSEAQMIVRRLIRPDPSMRLTTQEALKRPWFDGATVILARQIVNEYQSANDYDNNSPNSP